MNYRLDSTPTFEKAFKHLDHTTAHDIGAKLQWLSAHPELLRHPLRHLPPALKGLQKYRIGDWRVLCWVDHEPQIITLYMVEHRSRIYRDL